MQRTAKPHDLEWQMVDGALCVVFVGKDDRGQECRMAVPAVAITTRINAEARGRIAANEIERARLEAVGWMHAMFFQVTTFRVDLTDRNTVGIVCNPDTD